MAQQDFPYYWPLGFATAGEKIPGAAILQRRDGKDEPITLAGNMVWTGSMWVPVSDQNRLPVEATLTGSTMDLRGLASERPEPSPENKGVTYWSVDTGDVSVSTGTNWRSLGVA